MNKLLIFSLAILFSFSLDSCKKDKMDCTSDESFCSLVDDEDFDAVGTKIDDYLSGLDKNKPDENLNKLVDWLECMECVNNAEIICNSCIETYPPQSEIQVDFISNGTLRAKTIDIVMDETLSFGGYH